MRKGGQRFGAHALPRAAALSLGRVVPRSEVRHARRKDGEPINPLRQRNGPVFGG